MNWWPCCAAGAGERTGLEGGNLPCCRGSAAELGWRWSLEKQTNRKSPIPLFSLTCWVNWAVSLSVSCALARSGGICAVWGCKLHWNTWVRNRSPSFCSCFTLFWSFFYGRPCLEVYPLLESAFLERILWLDLEYKQGKALLKGWCVMLRVSYLLLYGLHRKISLL